MEIVFAGICCWVDSLTPLNGKTVVIPNASRGGVHEGEPIPPHSAFIHVKQGQAESSSWQPAITSEDNRIFLLSGDRITFDPVPRGGAIDISALPHVREAIQKQPICGAAEEFRPGFLHQPNPLNVAALAELPADAPVSTSANEHGAMFAVLTMPDAPVTITATPLSGGPARSLTIIDPSATVYVANVTLSAYLLRSPAEDDDHQYLVCQMFTRSGSASAPEALMSAEPAAPSHDPADLEAAATLTGTSVEAMQDFLCGFAAGCSDSQWP
jgi:hypothetical protein